VSTGIREPIGSVLRTRAAENPDRVCIAIDDTVWTYAEMDARSDTLAAGIAALGVQKGDRVATLAPNRPELLELFYGLAKAGAAQVPLNAFIKGEFLKHQLSQSGASVLITDASGRDAVALLRDELPALKTIVALDDAEGDEVPWSTLSEAGGTPPGVQLTPDDTMSIVYTSGTTGLPKGCVASHGYYCRCGDVIGHALELTDDDVLFAGLPLFHSGARLATVTMPLIYGIPAYLQGAFSASGYFPQARDCGATLMVAVGAMGAAVLMAPETDADRDHKVSRIMCAPLTGDMQQVFRDRFGVEPWVDIFGQSECMPVTLTPLSSDRRDPAGCGIAAPDLEVVLLDDDGKIVEGEATGEICLRPSETYALFDGYFERPADTLASLKGLWYHTGDYGKRLPSGAFAFVDRKKDSLRRRGENVSSVELEAAINTHPDVVESAVLAHPSELGEDDIKACLVMVEGKTLEPEPLFDYFKQRLPYFAVPRYVDVVAELPRNGVGRVMKHKLRDAGNSDATLDFEALGLVVGRDERR
jgi:crotonobetaine/carnitine-CoA ligase